jgi:murein DD-endopeptidase MepM/ murein hydrolase activator NlpD
MLCLRALVVFACALAWGRVGVASDHPCLDFQTLYADIRDGRVARDVARERLQALLPLVRDFFYAHGGKDAPRDAWRFPVDGYRADAIGGKNGSGYVAAGYDFFDGHKSHGHPAHDLFIHDRNEDELDDETRAPVRVLSMTSGIVVATASEWERGSVLRGGRYVWVYDPSQDGLVYYAHNREVLVKPGDIVMPGQAIATVGRSGRNASERRSPTHLHVMFLAIEAGYPRPRDIYRVLQSIARRPAGP